MRPTAWFMRHFRLLLALTLVVSMIEAIIVTTLFFPLPDKHWWFAVNTWQSWGGLGTMLILWVVNMNAISFLSLVWEERQRRQKDGTNG